MSPSILTELEMQKDYRANDLPNKMCQIKIDKGGKLGAPKATLFIW